MALISPYLQFTRLDTGAIYATATVADIPVWQFDRVLDAPGHIHLELNLLSTAAIAIVNATGGPTMADPIIALYGEFSLDGGSSYDMRFILVSAQRSLDPIKPVLIIDQSDQSVVYGVSGADRVTYVSTTGDIVLNALPGSVPRPAGSIGGSAGMPNWPTTKGLFQITPGSSRWGGQSLLQMTPYVDPFIATIPLSVDINADTTISSLKTIASRLAGVWNSSDPAPAGARAHWVSHTGDASRNPIGRAKQIALGRVGTSPKLTFDGNNQGTWDETTTIRFSGTGLSLDPRLEEMYAQTSMIGGISDHGIANGQGTSGAAATSILCMVCINTGRGSFSTGWDDNLLIIGTTAGVYYHVVGSGFLVPMSPVMVINAIVYQAQTQVLYIATPTGVFTAPAQPPRFGTGAVAAWTRVGGITAPVDDIWLDTVGVLLARCGGSTKKNGAGIDGIYQFPALSGDTSGDTQGYTGWSRIAHSGAPLAAGGTPQYLYYTDSNKPATVYMIQPGTTTAPVAVTGISAGQTVIGIDSVFTTLPGGGTSQYVYVRTDAGNAGLYSIQIGQSAAVFAAGGLASDDGSQVQIRRVVACGFTVFGEYVNAWAATDAGLFRTSAGAGNGWSAPNAVSGLGDFDIAMVAAGGVQTVLGELLYRINTGAERSLLISCDAGDSWQDVLAAKLDKGPSWYARAQRWGARPWPDNNLGGLGVLPAGIGSFLGSTGSILSPGGYTDTGGSGNVLSGSPGQEPVGFIRARRLDEQKQFTFRLVNLNTEAPQQGMQWNELSELQANANVGVISAAEQIELVESRWLRASAVPRWQLTLQGSITQDNAAGRDLAPTDMAALRYSPTGWTAVMALSLSAYVISHSIQGNTTAGLVRTLTVVSNTLEGANLDPTAMAAAQADRLVKRIRWGSA